MRNRRTRPPEYYAASDIEKLQWACGIPSRYWSVGADALRPVSYQYMFRGKPQRFSAADQEEYLKARIEEPELLRKNRFVCITSYPTDTHAMSAGCLLAYKAIQAREEAKEVVKVRVVDIQDYEQGRKDDEKFFSVQPEMIVVYNLSEDTPKERLTLVRDLLLSLEGIYRVVVASSENPLKFAREFLHIEPQEAYHFEGKARRVMRR